MGERSIGAVILIASILVAIAYFLWTFAAYLPWVPTWLVDISPWAIMVPVIIIVYAFLFIVMWIGYTMATTPVPKPLERPLEVETEKEAEEEKEKAKEGKSKK